MIRNDPSPMYHLIDDRNAEDVSRLKDLFRTSWDSMTGEEKEDYINGTEQRLIDVNGEECLDAEGLILTLPRTGQRGGYNAMDLNRVGTAAAYLSRRMARYGFYAPVRAKQDWKLGDFVDVSDLEAYLEDVRSIARAVSATLDEIPDDLRHLTPERANAIERILLDADRYLETFSWVYSGEVMSGEVVYE